MSPPPFVHQLLCLSSLVVFALFAMGCGTDDPHGGPTCEDGEVVGDQICHDGQWFDYDGPCAGVDCDQRGVCIDDGDDAGCQCDPGYEAQGFSCVEPEPDDPCDGVDCGPGGECVDVGGDPECDCDDGFEFDAGQDVCVATDPCDGVNCGPGGECVDVGGVPECDCDDGFELDPSLQICVDEDDPCDGVDCGDGGECVDDGGAASCDCDDGFEFDYSINQCVAADPCQDFPCPPEEVCVVEDDEPKCQCQPGYRDVGGNCVPEVQCQGGGQDCAVYVLDEGASSYERIDYTDTELGDALDEPVVAGFALEDTDRAYLLTESSYLRIDTTDFSVEATGALSELHPDLDGVDALQLAYTVPERHPNEDVGEGNDTVTFLRNPSNFNHGEALALRYDFSAEAFETEPLLEWTDDFDWSAEESDFEQFVPPIDEDFRAGWLDDENAFELVVADAAEACSDYDSPQPTVDVPIFGIVTGEPNTYFQTSGVTCSPFVDAHTDVFDDYGTSPAPAALGGAAWHNRTLIWFTAGYYE